MRHFRWMVISCLMAGLFGSGDSFAKTAEPGSPAPKPAATAPAVAATGAVSGGVINLNDASPEQLELLPGVGPSRASTIVSYRKSHPFKRLEELMRVKGFGKKTFARLRPLLALSGPTTMKERPSSAVSHRR